MAIDLDSGSGLFDRLGKLGQLLKVVNAAVGGTAANDWPTELKDALVKYDGPGVPNNIRAAVADLLDELISVQDAVGTFRSAIRDAAHNTLIQMANDDDPLPELSVAEAITELIEQMLEASPDETVDASEPGVATGYVLPDGDGYIRASIKSGNGKLRENILAETIDCKCTSTTTAGKEEFTCKGEAAVSDKLRHDWPAGSGINKILTAIDAGSSPNVVTNGTFEAFTGDTPNNWIIEVGSSGTHVKKVLTPFKGVSAVEFAGDGANLTRIVQTLSGLKSRTPYAIQFWRRINPSAPAAGVVQFDLHDGTSVIVDEAGTSNVLSVVISADTTTYAQHGAVFILPEPVPATVKLRIHLTTAITSGKSLYIDHLSLAPMIELITGGPWAAIFSGAKNFSLDDSFIISVTNAREGAFQELFDKFFDSVALGKQLPSATGGAETISDGLIA